jgi:agmatine/peptidylarginine deiminase
MPPKQDHKEIKVQKALELLKNNPRITQKKAYHILRAVYGRVTRRLQGIQASHTRGGYNKKLIVPQSEALKDYIEIYYAIGRSTNIEVVVASANSILRCNGSMAIVLRR